jgi:hypothetical protein
MVKFILRNNLYVMAALAAMVAIYLAVNWQTMPMIQRMVGLFLIGLVMHLWEEGRFPGGFVELITEHLHFTASDRTFGEVVTAGAVLIIALVPLFFPTVPFLAMPAMMLGIMEVIMHTAMIRMFRLPHFYSPGLATAYVLLLPISLYTLIFVIPPDLRQPLPLFLSFLCMVVVLVGAQQIVIRTSGVRYSDFLKNVRAAMARGRN